MTTRTSIAGLVAAVLCFSSASVQAQIIGSSLAKGISGVDMKAIAPVVQSVLDNDVRGTRRPWHSAAARGEVHLLSGGAAAGEKCGRVRLTIDRGERHPAFTFRYCQDAAGKWRTVG